MEEGDLSEETVRAHLATRWLGQWYAFTPEIDSTNDELKRRAAVGGPEQPPDGAVLLTDYQSAGRGRLNRRWEAPPGSSLLFSTLLRLDWSPEQAGWLTMIAGLAAAQAIVTTTGVDARLKWPNDVVVRVDNTWRKLGGLLVDTVLDGEGRVEMAVVGIGLNVNIPQAILPEATTPPTSLLAIRGEPLERRPLLVAVLGELERQVDAARAGTPPAAAWSDMLITLGKPVTVSEAGRSQPLLGVAEGTDPWGRLLVRDATGAVHTIAAGDVTLRGGEGA